MRLGFGHVARSLADRICGGQVGSATSKARVLINRSIAGVVGDGFGRRGRRRQFGGGPDSTPRERIAASTRYSHHGELMDAVVGLPNRKDECGGRRTGRGHYAVASRAESPSGRGPAADTLSEPSSNCRSRNVNVVESFVPAIATINPFADDQTASKAIPITPRRRSRVKSNSNWTQQNDPTSLLCE